MTVNGLARFEVRVPAEIRKQENVTRRFFAKEAEAKGYCARLASDLRNYSDKARGLTDEQKIAAQEAFTRSAEVPGASLTAAMEM